jgi:putative SOS response-associated peptidase YedK
MVFAGLWERWYREGEEPVESCTSITTTANEAMEKLHTRMPVILGLGHHEYWMDPTSKAVDGLLVPCEDRILAMYPVTPAANNARYQGEDCVKSVA